MPGIRHHGGLLLPKIDNERASESERVRFLALTDRVVKAPEHGGLMYTLHRGIAVKVLQATDLGSALKEACSFSLNTP